MSLQSTSNARWRAGAGTPRLLRAASRYARTVRTGGEETQVPQPRISVRQMPEPATIKSVRIGTWNMAGKWSDDDRALLESEVRDVWFLRARVGPASLPYRGASP